MYRSTFLVLGTSCLVVSFTPLPLYVRGKRPGYPLDRLLGGPQSLFARLEEEKNIDPNCHHSVAIQTMLYRLTLCFTRLIKFFCTNQPILTHAFNILYSPMMLSGITLILILVYNISASNYTKNF
jgi:hypothetical protein